MGNIYKQRLYKEGFIPHWDLKPQLCPRRGWENGHIHRGREPGRTLAAARVGRLRPSTGQTVSQSVSVQSVETLRSHTGECCPPCLGILVRGKSN